MPEGESARGSADRLEVRCRLCGPQVYPCDNSSEVGRQNTRDRQLKFYCRLTNSAIGKSVLSAETDLTKRRFEIVSHFELTCCESASRMPTANDHGCQCQSGEASHRADDSNRQIGFIARQEKLSGHTRDGDGRDRDGGQEDHQPS